MIQCGCPEDYYLKDNKSSLIVRTSLTLVDENVIEGLSRLKVPFDMSVTADVIKPPKSELYIAVCKLQIHWAPNTNYKFRFSPDFIRDKDNQSNPEFEINYTTNPLPAFDAEPAFNQASSINNTTIKLTFDRLMCYGDSGYIYLYEVSSPSDILLYAYQVGTLGQAFLEEDGAGRSFITLETLGQMKANTQYYLLTDPNILRDYDNFYLPQITDANFYTFRTDTSENLFPDLISIEFVTGNVSAISNRIRPFASQLNVDSDLVSNNIRIRFHDVTSSSQFDITPIGNYANGNLTSNMDLLVSQETIGNRFAGGVFDKDANFNLDSTVGVRKLFNSTQLSNFNFTPSSSFWRYRTPKIFLDTSFNQSILADYGLLSSTRGNIVDFAPPVALFNGPLLTDSRGPTEPLRYNLTISPDATGQFSTANINSSLYDISFNNTVLGPNQSGPGGTPIGSELGHFVAFSRDGTKMAAVGQDYVSGNPNNPFIIVYEKDQTGNWIESQTITGISLVRDLFLNKNGTLLATNNTVYNLSNNTSTNVSGSFIITSMNANGDTISAYDATNRAVKIYKLSSGTWSLETTINRVLTAELFGISASLSDDGNTIAIGATNSTGVGRVYIYNKINNVWTQQTFLTGSLGSSNDQFGVQVNLSGDSKTVLIRASVFWYIFSNNSGSFVEEFVRSGTPTGHGDISRNGDTAIFSITQITGGPLVEVYTRYNSVWTLKQSLTTPAGGTPPFWSGTCAVDGEANNFAIGHTGGYVGQGAVHTYKGPGFIFDFSNSIITITGAKEEVSQAIDNIQITMVPKVGVTVTTLTYTATRPTDNLITARTQTITY